MIDCYLLSWWLIHVLPSTIFCGACIFKPVHRILVITYGPDARKQSLGLFIPKPACSATETSYNSELSLVASFDDTFQ